MSPAHASESSPVTDAPAATGAAGFPSPRQLFVLLACYFALQVASRVFFSTSTDLDESEAVVLAQKFSWGYGSDPPLYAWIQMLFFRVIGTSVLALSLFKNLLLLSTYLLTFATARLVTRNPVAAVAAALSVFYLPSIAWESQRDLTHSVLSATLSIATLFSLVKLSEARRLSWYVVFGLCAGLGILSKYNYALWLVGLVLAGLSLKEIRPGLLDRRLLLSAGIAALIFLPNGLWMLENRGLALLNSSKFGLQESLTWAAATSTGLRNIAQSVTAFTAPLALVYLLVFLKAGPVAGSPAGPTRVYRRLIFRSWGIIGAGLVLLVVVAHATGLKERWFQPILIALPVAAVTLVKNRLSSFRLKCLAAVSLVVMTTVAVVMPGRLLMAERLGREEPLTRPYARLAADLRPDVPPNSLLICNTQLLAGNLRLGLPDATPLNAELVPLFGENYPHCFLVWDARGSDAVPEALREWALQHHPSELAAARPRFASETYRYHSTKTFRIGFLQLY